MKIFHQKIPSYPHSKLWCFYTSQTALANKHSFIKKIKILWVCANVCNFCLCMFFCESCHETRLLSKNIRLKRLFRNTNYTTRRDSNVSLYILLRRRKNSWQIHCTSTLSTNVEEVYEIFYEVECLNSNIFRTSVVVGCVREYRDKTFLGFGAWKRKEKSIFYYLIRMKNIHYFKRIFGHKSRLRILNHRCFT